MRKNCGRTEEKERGKRQNGYEGMRSSIVRCELVNGEREGREGASKEWRVRMNGMR